MSFNKGRRAREAWYARQQQEQTVAAEPNAEPTVNERLLSVLEQTVANQATQNDRLAPRENPRYVTNSPTMKPNGEQWSKDLKCEMFLGPFPLHDTPLTKDEVAAANRLEPAVGLWLTKNDQSRVKVNIVGKVDAVGRLERLTVQMPLRNEDGAKIGYPSITAIATELAEQLVAVPA